MEGQLGLSELSVISWMSAVEGCPLSGVPLEHLRTSFLILEIEILYMCYRTHILLSAFCLDKCILRCVRSLRNSK